MHRESLLNYIESGKTEAEIAKIENVVPSTARYWLKKYGLKTQWKRGGWSRNGNFNKNPNNRFKPSKVWDWNKIQKAHDDGATWLKLCGLFGLNITAISKAAKLGLFISRNASEAKKLAHANGRIDYSVYRTPQFRGKCSKNGGYKPKAGVSKGGYATNVSGEEFYLQSSYELNMARILNDMNILWVRPTYFIYKIDNRKRKYYPDFLLPNYNLYLDTKNDFLIKKDGSKIDAVKKQNIINLEIVRKDQINSDHIQSLLNIYGNLVKVVLTLR